MRSTARLLLRNAAVVLCLLGALWPAYANQRPVVVSVAGSSTAYEASYVFTFSDPDGYGDLGVLNILVNDFLDGRSACYLGYSQPTGALYIVGDAGTGLTGNLLTGTGTLSNSQCSVDLSRSFASGSGNTLTPTLHIAFSATFGGDRIFYLAARDRLEANSGWSPMGTMRIPVGLATPRVESVVPVGGSGSTHRVSVTFRDSADAGQLTPSQILINEALDGRNACYLGYDHANNRLYLVEDAGGGLLGGVIPGIGGPGRAGWRTASAAWTGPGRRSPSRKRPTPSRST